MRFKELTWKPLLIGGALFLGILLFLGSILLKINSIRVEAADLSCASKDQLEKELNFKGKNYLLLNSGKITQSLQARHICIESIRLIYNFPNILVMQVNGRKPIALLKEVKSKVIDLEYEESSDSSYYLVDLSGFLYAKTSDDGSLSLIEIVDLDLDVKKNIGNKAEKALFVLEKVKSIVGNPNNVKIFNDDLYVDGSPKLKFTLNSNLDRQVASLQLILQKDRMKLRFSPSEMGQSLNSKEKNEIEMIDLRFDKPIVVYTPKR